MCTCCAFTHAGNPLLMCVMVYQSAVTDKPGIQCAVCLHDHDALTRLSECQQDKELKAMAAQVTKLMVSLHDIEVLAMAVKSDAAASCKVSSS